MTPCLFYIRFSIFWDFLISKYIVVMYMILVVGKMLKVELLFLKYFGIKAWIQYGCLLWFCARHLKLLIISEPENLRLSNLEFRSTSICKIWLTFREHNMKFWGKYEKVLAYIQSCEKFSNHPTTWNYFDLFFSYNINFLYCINSKYTKPNMLFQHLL